MNDYREITNWHKGITLEDLRGKLIKRGFNSVILNSIGEIHDYILKAIPNNATVGFGGSVTLRETGIDRLLRERGNTVLDHWDKSLAPEQALDIRKRQLTSDYFLTSLNAITMEGELVNIDGAGNRVAAMIFGPKHVIALAGYNKIVRNLDEALWRTKNIASPRNSKRLNLETPCAKKGYCMDCKHPVSICRITTIIDYKPILTEFTIILTPLELGF